MVYAVLTDGLGQGTVDLVVERLDNEEEVYNYQNQLVFSDPLQEVRVLFRLEEFSFPSPGRYQFSLLLDDVEAAHRVVEVYVKEGP